MLSLKKVFKIIFSDVKATTCTCHTVENITKKNTLLYSFDQIKGLFTHELVLKKIIYNNIPIKLI